jgi:hypothetical protein
MFFYPGDYKHVHFLKLGAHQKFIMVTGLIFMLRSQFKKINITADLFER